jgi:hypothetical protein
MHSSVPCTVPFRAQFCFAAWRFGILKHSPMHAYAGRNCRMYLISRQPIVPLDTAGCPMEKFKVLGATGTIYTVHIGRTPHCNCPETAKGNICMHRYFVMLRVLKAAERNPMVWQAALLESEVCPCCEQLKLACVACMCGLHVLLACTTVQPTANPSILRQFGDPNCTLVTITR